MNNVLIDTIIGGILLGFISYLSDIYKNNPEFYKILAFLWAVPLTFFFFINIASRSNKKAMKDFSIHAIIGIVLTFILALITIYIIKFDKNIIVLFSFLFSAFFTFIYFYFKIYKY